MDNLTMHTLYDSDTYSVTHMLANAVTADVPAENLKEGEQVLIVPRLARHGFEIVDKRTNKEVYLDGSWAELFQQQISAWQEKTPTQEEVEDKLEQYAMLAQNPVVIH
jgi:hydrogenase maturation factor